MEKGKNSKNLKEKVLFLMCLGALAGNMSTEIYALEDPIDYNDLITEKYKYSKDEIKVEKIGNNNVKISYSETDEINKGISISHFQENNNVNINLSFDNTVKINNSMIKVDNSSTSKYENIAIQFNKNLSIDNKNDYALYSSSSTSGGGVTASIKIGDENSNKNIIKIIGNIEAYAGVSGGGDGTTSSSKIILNLNNSDSYFAGQMKTTKSASVGKANASIEMNLKDNAIWYAHDDTYTIDGSDENLKTLITSKGGVIDIYYTAPNESPLSPTAEQLEKLKQLEKIAKQEFEKLKEQFKNDPNYINNPNYIQAKQGFEKELIKLKADILDGAREKGERTFTLNGVGDRLQNTTFRISTDVENKKSDKIVLNGVEVKKDSETYFIEIAADPFKSGEWKAGKDDKILVMDINAESSNIDDLNKITVEGKESEAEIGAGLVKQKIIPTVEEDTANKGDWYLTSIDKIESKGSGHIFAEIGAAANVGMASAWRTDSGDLYQRMGNLRNNEAEQGVWGRIYTGENEVRKGIGLDLEYRAVQVGYDRKENIDGGKLFTGIAFGYFDGNADYDHGSGESNSATVGMYAAYSGNNGSFGDFIVKLGNIDNKLSYTSESGDYYKADYDTYGFSADAEYGYRYEFDNDYYIEPLAQLSYIYIADEEYTMNLNGESGAKVSNDDYQSLIGYAGFHYGKKFGDNVAYLRVVAAHEFAGDIDVDARYQDIKVNSSISGEDTWVEYGVGFDVKVKEDTAVYGRLQKSTGDVVKNKWHASVGLRYTF